MCVILVGMSFDRLNEVKPLLLKIGSQSMFIINSSRVEKGDVWEAAVEINHIAHRLHDSLVNGDLEEAIKEDPTLYG